MEHLLRDLTGPQREAVLHHDGPLLILAGPGSGKTRVITHRIARMLADGVTGRQILALTFTNKAADEMRLRVQRLAPGSQVWIGTFHRFCARLLRKYAPLVGLEENYTIYDTGDSARALHRTVGELHVDAAFASPESIAREISWAKNNLIVPSRYPVRAGNPLGSVVQRIYPAYQAKLAASNAVDFDDLLLHVATLLREADEVRAALDERYRYILVDEYQDTNLAQYAIARALSNDYPNLAVTGDPDQSIYGWRGANLNNILDFEKDFPDVRVVRLERNYRSTQRILRVADDLISHNLRRKKKALFTENEAGERVRLVTYRTHKDEAEGIAAEIAGEIAAGRRHARDFAVFYRTNALSRSFELALREVGVPYQMVNGVEFFQRKEIKDVLAFLQLVNNPHDEVALLRVINTPPRGIGKTTIERLSHHAARYGTSLLDAARGVKQVEAVSRRAAGLVADFVAIVDRLIAAARGPIEELLGLVLSESGYEAVLKASGDEEDEERLANIQELLTVAREFDERSPEAPAPPAGGRLEAFLEETALVNDTDDWETQLDRVTLMTLHASKGLEFPCVFLVAVEEGLLPHERSRNQAEQLEEERRLMFVGITRAQQRLQLSLAQYRDFRGERKPVVPSSFLMELPRGEMEVHQPETTRRVEIDAEAAHQAEHQEPVFRRDEPQRTAPAGLGPGLRTAAEMLGVGRPRGTIDPDVFRQGMVVLHPQYGIGKVVALGGSGDGRTATIDFAAAAGRKKLPLAGSELRPVKRDAN